MDKISSLLYKNNVSGETGSSKSRPSSAHPLHARPSSAGATRSRSTHRGSTGATNRDRDRESALPTGVYGQVFGASSSSGKSSSHAHNAPAQQQQQQQQQTSNAPPLLHVNSLGAHTQYQPNGMPARPRSAGAVRRPQGVDTSNLAPNQVPSSMPAIYAPAAHNHTYEQSYQTYYQSQNNAPVVSNNTSANKQPNSPANPPGTTSGVRPLSAGAVPYKLLYGAQTQTQPVSPHNTPTQAQQTLNGPPVNAANGVSSNSSAASKLRQALDLSRHLLANTTPSHNNDVPISALLGATHLADLNTAHNAPTQHTLPQQSAQQPTLTQQHTPSQQPPHNALTQSSHGALTTQLTTHDTHTHTDDEPLLGVEGALRTSEEENEEVDLDEMDGKRVSGSQHPEVSLSHSHLSHTMDLLTQPSAHTQAHTTTTELRNTSIDSFPDENAINVGLSTVPNQFCTKRDALELKKLLLLSQGTRGGIVPSSSAVMDMYMVGKVVGVGSYGKVRAAWHRLTGCKVAIKTYDKAKLKDPSHWKRVHSEIKIMEQISHPRIARMYEAVETPKRMHLIMECLDGGNLCSYVKAKKRLSEDESRRIFFQILQAIEHLHALGVSHRDVKLENVLFVNDRDIKLIDFGFSTVCQPGKKLKVFCGTPSYMAPEIVRRLEYEGRPVDIWSLGILLYALLCGCFPFRAKAYPDLYRRIARGTFAIPDELSAPVKDLLRQLLTVDSEQRVTAHSALRHSWLQVQLVNAPNMDRMRKEMVVLISDQPAEDVDEEVLSELSAFGMSREEIVRIVLSKTHCSIATLYYLLLDTVISKRRLAGNKKALPSGLGNFSFNSATANANNINNPIAGAALPHYAQPQNNMRAQSRPKTASGVSPHFSSHAYNTQSNNTNTGGAVPLQMYVPGVMPQVVSPYETLLQQHQQHQQQQQQQQHQQQQQTFTQAQTPAESFRPRSASGTRSSSTGTQRPLSAYAGRR